MTPEQEERLKNMYEGKPPTDLAPLSEQEANKMLDDGAVILARSHNCLLRFTIMLQLSVAAKYQVEEARAILQEINEWMLRR